MKYFCAKCQQKHNISDIAVDLWEICANDVRININGLLSKLEYDPDLADLNFNLTSFLGNRDRSGRLFLFKGDSIRTMLRDRKQEGMVSSGVFTLKVQWLMEAYEKVAVGEELETAQRCKDLVKDIHDEVVFSRKLNFTFAKIGASDEMFDNVTDENNDPFTDSGTGLQRGYLRVCPHCGGRLAPAVGRAQEVVIALSGAPRAGKTSCMVAVVSALIQKHYANLYMDIPSNDPLWDKLALEIERFSHSVKVEKTRVDETEVPAFSFLVNAGQKKFVLTFVDMPGEFMEGKQGLTTEFYKQYMGLYRNIDCIWHFISKLSVHEAAVGKDGSRTAALEKIIKAANDPDSIRAGVVENAANDFSKVMDPLQKYLEDRNHSLPPLAIIITKTELDLGNNEEIANLKIFPAPKDCGYSIAHEENKKEMDVIMPACQDGVHVCEWEYFKRSAAVCQYLRSKNSSLAKAIESKIKNRTYIAMAAYGHPAYDPPAPGEPLPNYPPESYHELLPLVWTLSITGMVPVMHHVTELVVNIFGSIKERFDHTPDFFFNYRACPTAANRNEEEKLRSIWRCIGENMLSRNTKYQSTETKTRRVL